MVANVLRIWGNRLEVSFLVKSSNQEDLYP